MLLRNLLLLSLSCFACSRPRNSPQGCPQTTTLGPCTCSYDEPFESSISCGEKSQGADELRRIFLGFSGNIFREVKIENVHLEHLPVEILEASEVQSLFVNSSSLTRLFDRPPKVEYSLYALTLVSVQIQNGLDFQQLGEIENLSTLTLSDVRVPFVGDDFRDHVSPELTFLALERTETQVISPGAFSRLGKLRTLAVVETEITTLSRNVLPFPSQVENLFLNYNKLAFLPDDVFTEVPNLKVLSLVGNQFSTLDPATFAAVWSTLRYVGADVNPIQCDCRLRWLASSDDKTKVRGVCVSPPEFRGTNLQDLEAEDFEYCHGAEGTQDTRTLQV